MINLLKRKLWNWLSQDAYTYAAETKQPIAALGNRPLGRGLELCIHRANGGWIVEFSTYDRKTDETNRTLHLITNEQDLGDSLAKIITFELISR
jgi:hypothetical protein